MPFGHNLLRLCWGLWGGGGVVILKAKISRPFNYAEKNGYLQNLIKCVLGVNGCGEGGLVALQSLLTLKRALVLSISDGMNLFRSFYDNKRPSQNVYQTHFGKIGGMGGEGISPPPRSLCILKRTLKLLVANPLSPLRSSYAHPLYKNLVCPPEHNLQPLP